MRVGEGQWQRRLSLQTVPHVNVERQGHRVGGEGAHRLFSRWTGLELGAGKAGLGHAEGPEDRRAPGLGALWLSWAYTPEALPDPGPPGGSCPLSISRRIRCF